MAKTAPIVRMRRTRVSHTASMPWAMPGVMTVSTICCRKIEPTDEATDATTMQTATMMRRTR